MPIPGLVSITYRQLSPAAIISRAAAAGLSCIEWGSDVHVPPTDLENARLVGEMTRAAGLTVSSYGSYFRLGAGQDFAPYVAAARALGAPLIRIWAGSRGSAQTDAATRATWVTEAKAAARLAADADLRVAFEYHPGTLTDDSDSAASLMREVSEPNCGLYWQPDFTKSPAAITAGLEAALPYLQALHVFYWHPDHSRRPLADGIPLWREYIARVPDREHMPLLLEFVPGDDPTLLPREAAALREIASKNVRG